jgi:hypothetical protein
MKRPSFARRKRQVTPARPLTEQEQRTNARFLDAINHERERAAWQAEQDHRRKDVGDYDGPMLGDLLGGTN